MTTPTIRNHDDCDPEDYSFEHSQVPPELRAMNASPAHQELEELDFEHPRTREIERSMVYYQSVRRLKGEQP